MLWTMRTRLNWTRTYRSTLVGVQLLRLSNISSSATRWNAGRTAVDRLAHIISLSPSIAPQAFALAAQHIQQGRDPGLYTNIIFAYEATSQSAQASGATLPQWQEIAPLDQKWVDETNSRNQAERSKLEVELKTYSNNMIKESIRVRGFCCPIEIR